MKKVLTLGFLLKENAICLALKKRGFGEGYWNGFGGKLEEGESIKSGMVREIKEESTVSVSETDLEKIVINEFFFKDGRHLEVHVFFIRTWKGEPTETEEMKPAWFSHTEIPYKKMWADDLHWLPRALQGEKLIGKVWFSDNDASIEKMEWKTTPALP